MARHGGRSSYPECARRAMAWRRVSMATERARAVAGPLIRPCELQASHGNGPRKDANRRHALYDARTMTSPPTPQTIAPEAAPDGAGEFETVIGLEVHSQLKTASKMFCRCPAQYADAAPNTHVCPICQGMPGMLPVINETAVEWTIRAALALHMEIPELSKFDRKNYHYPDLMKGYQISQFDEPLSLNGYLDVEVDGRTRRIGVTRIHLEEDTARLLHREDATGRDVLAAGPESQRRAADGVRVGAGHAQPRGGAGLPGGPAADLPLPRRLDGGHGEGVVPLRREHLAAAVGAGGLRDQGGSQEHELVPGRLQGAAIRAAPAGGGAAQRGAHPPGDAGLGGRPRGDGVAALEGGVGRLPLLPGPRPAAAAHGAGSGRGDPGGAAGVAGGAAGALPGAVRPGRLRVGAADGRPRDGGLLRGGGRGAGRAMRRSGRGRASRTGWWGRWPG